VQRIGYGPDQIRDGYLTVPRRRRVGERPENMVVRRRAGTWSRPAVIELSEGLERWAGSS
jgi:hypothetical protein